MIDDDKLDSAQDQPVKISTKKGGINAKIFIIGIPLFIVQLVVVYFITANILLNKMAEKEHPGDSENGSTATEKAEGDSSANVELGKFLYQVDDIIVNPAGTKGKELLLASVAFDLKSEENKVEMEGKDVLVKDLVISVLSSKNIAQLGNTSYRDTLRIEIQSKLNDFLPTVGVNKVYFSKYIIN